MVLRALFISVVFSLLSVPALAQGGNVFGPTVREGDRSWEWRANAVIDEDSEWSWSTRLHYQHAFNDAWRLRGVAQFELDGAEAIEPDFARAELLWQYQEETRLAYQAAFRFEGRLNYRGPHRAGVSWAHQFVPTENWRVRAILNAEQEIGAGANAGIRINHRTRVSRTLGGGVRGALEAYGRFGNLSDGIPGFDQQRHTAGPALFGPINDQWRWHVTSQWALTRAASDAPLRARLYYRF